MALGNDIAAQTKRQDQQQPVDSQPASEALVVSSSLDRDRERQERKEAAAGGITTRVIDHGGLQSFLYNYAGNLGHERFSEQKVAAPLPSPTSNEAEQQNGGLLVGAESSSQEQGLSSPNQNNTAEALAAEEKRRRQIEEQAFSPV